MPPVGFEPAISAVKRPQTNALDRAATGTGCARLYYIIFFNLSRLHGFCDYSPVVHFDVKLLQNNR